MASVCYVSYHSREHATTRQHELVYHFTHRGVARVLALVWWGTWRMGC